MNHGGNIQRLRTRTSQRERVQTFNCKPARASRKARTEEVPYEIYKAAEEHRGQVRPAGSGKLRAAQIAGELRGKRGARVSDVAQRKSLDRHLRVALVTKMQGWVGALS